MTAAAITASLTSCSAVNPEAMRVGSRSISQREFEQAIAALAKHPAAAAAAGADTSFSAGTVAGRQDSTTMFQLEVLSNVFVEMVTRLGIPTSAPQTDAVIARSFGVTAEAFTAFPAGLRARLTTASADATAARDAVNGPTPDEAAERAFFETVKDQVNGATFEQVQPQIQQQLRTQWNVPFQAAIGDLVKTLEIRVDPRYGSWDPAQGFAAPKVPLAGPAPAAVPAGA